MNQNVDAPPATLQEEAPAAQTTPAEDQPVNTEFWCKHPECDYVGTSHEDRIRHTQEKHFW